MRKFIISLVVPLLLALSCTKVENQYLNESSCDDQSLSEFASILSKALYAEPELRALFKEEALKRVDYDYDVVYSLIKDVEIKNGVVVEDVIRSYDEGNCLDHIVDAHPVLSVLIPDWSWVHEDCFSVNEWDTSEPELGVSYMSRGEHPVYFNGEYAFSMDDGEFSTAPILIVKDNDRIRAARRTKAGNDDVSFIWDDFKDLSENPIRTKASKEHTDFRVMELPYSRDTNILSVNVLDGRLSTVYGETKTDDRFIQRDFIYYGLTSRADSGYLNHNYYERLYCFKLDPNAGAWYDNSSDNTSNGNDFKFKDYNYLADTWANVTWLSTQDLLSKSWGDGCLEIAVRVYNGGTPLRKYVSVCFGDAFAVKKVDIRENYNWLGKIKSRYYYLGAKDNNRPKSEWLEPKWIKADIDLFCWDLAAYPTKYYVEFSEVDDGATIKKEWSESFDFAGNVRAELSGSNESGTLKFGVGLNLDLSKKKTISLSETYTDKDDDLGNFVVDYADKVILSQNADSVLIKAYDTGVRVVALIIPSYE